MRIKEGFLRVNTSPVDSVHGAKPDDAERPAESVAFQPIPVNLSTGQSLGVMNHPGAIRTEGIVSEFAGGIRRQCGQCRHFDRETWLQMRHAIEASEDILVRDELNGLRAHFLTSPDDTFINLHEGMDGDLDVEHAISSMGLCRAYTAYLKCPEGEEVIVHPVGVCPEKLGDLWPDSPDAALVLPILYEPRNHDTRKQADQAYDALMNAASGKKP